MARLSPEETYRRAVDSYVDNPAFTLELRARQIANVGVSAALAAPDLTPKQRADVVLKLLPILAAFDVIRSNMPFVRRRVFTSESARVVQGRD